MENEARHERTDCKGHGHFNRSSHDLTSESEEKRGDDEEGTHDDWEKFVGLDQPELNLFRAASTEGAPAA